MSMTTLEFLKLKNALVFRVTSKVLIPEDQLADTPKVTLRLSGNLIASNCPYCALYSHNYNCQHCPMSEAGNFCFNKDSTYRIADLAWDKHSTYEDHDELINLIHQYNKED